MHKIRTINNSNKIHLLKAFSLAEILVTLTVIGVIASLTIPALLQNINDAHYKAAWKKSFSELSQVTQKIMLDKYSFKNTFNNTEDLRDTYAKNFGYIKSCSESESLGNCWHANDKSKFYNGTYANWINAPGVILNNGSLLSFSYVSACDDSTSGLAHCGWIFVDVNGFKGPNVHGKDIYGVHIMENKILPYGTKGDLYQTIEGGTGWNLSSENLMQ